MQQQRYIPGSFIFKSNEEQNQEAQKQTLNQLQQQKSKLTNLQNMQNPPQEMATYSNHNKQSITQNVSTDLIIVQPTKPTLDEDSQNIETIILYTSQTSQSHLDVDKLSKMQDIPSGNRSHIVFQYEESEEIQFSPQSSLRKLYKSGGLSELNQIEEYEKPQRFMGEQLAECHSEQYEQDQNSDIDQQFQKITNKKQLKSNNIYDLIIYPIPKTKMIRCLVIITNNKLFSLESIFDLYLVQEKRHLLRAKKKKFRIYSTFQIFAKQNQHPNQIATIRSNFTRTQYKLIKYRREESQKFMDRPSQAFSSEIIKITPMTAHYDVKVTEEQCCYIGYESNFLGFNQQRLTILKPKKKISKTNRFSDLNATYQNCQYQRVSKYTTRLAQKGPDGKLVLDFKEKNIVYSTRNMIIESQFGEAGLIFAKFSQDIYILNVMNPFNLLQGFFLGLCNLDKKLFVS